MKTHQNLQNAAKVVHRRMFIALSAVLENKIWNQQPKIWL